MIAKIFISNTSNTLDEYIEKDLKKIGLTNPHPDLLYFDKDSKLGIEQAREIKDFFSIKPFSATGRGVVLANASVLTPDAQQALLKTLEELPAKGLFILISNTDASFLPTVLSRCQVIRSEVEKEKEDFREIENLINSSLEQRFEYVEKCKDKEKLLNSLISFFRKKMFEDPKYSQILEELLEMEKYMKQNVNPRGILEYLMLKIP